MTEDEIRTAVLGVLREVAPEVDPATVDPAADLREDFGLDSMDILNLATGIYERTGVDVPERDYPLIVTLSGCMSYVVDHAPA